ncbi:hypothetical protein F4861DRAFT_497685 [Xylaria intraflava]|nr:hypothetical protein F4861DRAFT_497685 [Xylaria intraflava]
MRTAAISLFGLLSVATAVPVINSPEVEIVVEASHGGAGSGLTNTTITVPVGPLYTNKAALAAVSTLYLLDDETVSCIPYQSEDGTGTHGLPFTVGHPSFLSTNTVVVGSIRCTSN